MANFETLTIPTCLHLWHCIALWVPAFSSLFLSLYCLDSGHCYLHCLSIMFSLHLSMVNSLSSEFKSKVNYLHQPYISFPSVVTADIFGFLVFCYSLLLSHDIFNLRVLVKLWFLLKRTVICVNLWLFLCFNGLDFFFFFLFCPPSSSSSSSSYLLPPSPHLPLLFL